MSHWCEETDASAQSPDLNTIKNNWDELKHTLPG